MKKYGIFLFILLVSIASKQALGFNNLTCGISAFGGPWVIQHNDPANIEIEIFSFDYPPGTPEYLRIKEAIENWNNIGGTSINVTVTDTDPTDPLLAQVALTYQQVGNNEEQLAFFLHALHSDDGKARIYKRPTQIFEEPDFARVNIPVENYAEPGCNSVLGATWPNGIPEFTEFGDDPADIIIHTDFEHFGTPIEVTNYESHRPLFEQLDDDKKVDLNLVVSHEFGHYLGLLHPGDPATPNVYQYKPAIMLKGYANGGNLRKYFPIGPEQVRQGVPLPDDRSGLRHVYPNGSSALTDVAVTQNQHTLWDGGASAWLEPDAAPIFRSRFTVDGTRSVFTSLGWAGWAPFNIMNNGTQPRWVDVNMFWFRPGFLPIWVASHSATVAAGDSHFFLKPINAPLDLVGNDDWRLSWQITNAPSGDSNVHNNFDVSGRTFSVFP